MCAVPVIEPGVLERIREHVTATTSGGSGGILIGRPGVGSVTIDAALRAEHVEAHDGEIAFLPETWERAYEVAAGQQPGSRIVGWYHSHPGRGIRLSEYDRRLHSLLFPDAGAVALVLDPVAGDAAWYAWSLDRVSARGEPPPADGAQNVRRRPVGAAAVVAGLVLAGSLGWWVGRTASPSSPTVVVSGPDRLADLRRRLRDARDEVTRDQAELRGTQARLAGLTDRLEAVRADLREARTALRAARAGASITYRVRPGDTFSGLAASFLGDAEAWPRIWQANRSRVPDPDRLPAGAVITIPH